MKILTVVFSLSKGGTQRAAVNFSIGYSKLGHDSRLLLLFSEYDGIRRTTLERNKIIIYNYEKIQEIADWKPDLIHLHSHALTEKRVINCLKLSQNAKIVETNVFSEPNPWSKYVEISFQLSNWCDWLFKKRTKNLYNTEILGNPIICENFWKASENEIKTFKEKYELTHNQIVLGRIGQATISKWSPKIIEVFENLSKTYPNISLLLVNPPNTITDKIKNSYYKNKIKIIKKITDDNLLRICYSSIDIFIHIANQGESFGYVLAESLLCQTPVVTLQTPWADNTQCELVGNGRGGKVCFYEKSFTNVVKNLIEDEGLRKHYGKLGRNYIIKNYNYIDLAKKSIDLCSKNYSYQKGKISPFKLSSNSVEKIDIISKLILKSETFFKLLKITTNFESPLSIIKRKFFEIYQKLKK